MTSDTDQVASVHEALKLLNAGQWNEAEQLLLDCTAREPSDHAACHLLGVTYFKQGNTHLAHEWIAKAITLNGNYQQYFNNLALVLSADGNDRGALDAAKKAVFLAPDNADTQTTYGVMLQRCDQLVEASRAYRIALDIEPNHAQALINTASLDVKASRYDKAEERYRQALAANPSSLDAILGLATCMISRRHFDQAIEILVAERPRHPGSPQVPIALADAFLRQGMTNQAVETLESAAIQFESNAAVWNNFGYALRDLPDPPRAVSALERSLELDKGYSPAADNLGQLLLSLGQYEKGWSYFRQRKNIRPNVLAESAIVNAFPDILPNEGTIVVWTEQGVGDEVLQVNLVNDLCGSYENVTLMCSDRTRSLFERSFPRANVLPKDRDASPLVLADTVYAPLIDFASLLRPTVESFPEHSGYLEPAPTEVTKIRQRYLTDRPPETLLIGVSWQSFNESYGDANTIPLNLWGPVFKVIGGGRPITFVANQFGNVAEEVGQTGQTHGADFIYDERVDHGGDIGDVAAQVAAMDLVISTSTTTAQIAGALGKPTIHLAANGLACGWYWGTEGESTPWYPSMRILRRTADKTSQIDDASKAFCKALGKF